MKEGLERCKEALEYVRKELSLVGWGPARKPSDILSGMDAILNPAPVMEDVEEIVGWVNVYQNKDGSFYVSSGFLSEEAANNWVNSEPPRISCQPIKVTVQREKKQPVERSVTVEAVIDEYGVPRLSQSTGYVFGSNKEFHNCKGSLTFTTTETEW